MMEEEKKNVEELKDEKLEEAAGGGCRAKTFLQGNGLLGIDEEVCSYYKDGYKKRKDELLSSLAHIL